MLDRDLQPWVERVLIPAVRGQSIPSVDEHLLGGLALLSADTNQVKQYVFESDKLPEIRGASAILRALNEEVTEGQPSIRQVFAQFGLPAGLIDEPSPGCLVYAGGGSVLALVPSDYALRICHEIESLYPRVTGTATISAVYASVAAAELREQLNALLGNLQYRLQRAKESRSASPIFEAVPHARRCASCGLRPAAKRDPRPFEDRWLCEPCHLKLERSLHGEKTEYVRDFERTFQAAGWPREEYWRDHAEAKRGATSIPEIAQAEHEHRFIGFIYADGDGIGDKLFRSRDLAEFRRNSKALSVAVHMAVFQTLAEHTRVCQVKDDEGQPQIIHPWEIIALGGDDALLIVPGDLALPIAEAICRHFSERLLDAGWPEPATMSAGVVIAHESNPVRFVRELAEQLLKSAKRRTHEMKRSGQAEGAVDFVVLKSQSMVAADLSTLRKQVYRKTVGGRETLDLTGRPLRITELRDLLTQARLLRDEGFPRSQTHAIRAELWEAERKGRPWSALFYHRQKARMSRRRRAVLNVIANHWLKAQPDSPVDLYPWLTLPSRRGRSQAKTVWEDLIEIRQLLPEHAHERTTTHAEIELIKRRVDEEEERLRKEESNGYAEPGD